MENIEITPKELYETLQKLTFGVSNIQTEIAVLKTQLSVTAELQTRIKELEDKMAHRDRSFVQSFIGSVVFGSISAIITALILLGIDKG